ncbi:Intraflagellar transport protein 57 homolog [Coccomyxa sp. Obi]|nr:Intraflagellar transport protein 57 homolog [Coccomyxa sp. Obi]
MEVSMELLLDKLKLLNYEDECVLKRKMKHLSRFYFATPSATQSPEQVVYFANLVHWLLQLSGIACTAQPHQNDAHALCKAIMEDLQAAGFSEPGISSSDLEAGWGNAVISVLNSLADLALKSQQFSWTQPLRHPEMQVAEAEVDAEAEITAEEWADNSSCSSSEDSDGLACTVTPQREASMPVASRQEYTRRWRQETARVSHLLEKENSSGSEVWRSRPDNAHQLYQQLHAEWPQLKASLDMVKTKIGSDMGRIAEREHAINTQVSGLAADLREAKQQLSASQEERLQLEKSNKDLEVDLNCTVQVRYVQSLGM